MIDSFGASHYGYMHGKPLFLMRQTICFLFFFFFLFYFFLNKGQIRHIDVHCTLLFLDVSIYPAYHDKNHKFWHYYMVIDERHSAKIEIFRCGLDWTYLTSTSYVYVLTLFFFSPAAAHAFWETIATVHEQ